MDQIRWLLTAAVPSSPEPPDFRFFDTGLHDSSVSFRLLSSVTDRQLEGVPSISSSVVRGENVPAIEIKWIKLVVYLIDLTLRAYLLAGLTSLRMMCL